MRPTRMLIGHRAFAGGMIGLLLASPAMAGFTLRTVFDDATPVSDGLTFLGSFQVVAGNNGVVATSSVFHNSQNPDDQYSALTLNQSNGNAATQIVAQDSSLGDSLAPTLQTYTGSMSASPSFITFAELALSGDGLKQLTFVAEDDSSNFGLFKSTFTTGTPTPGVIQYGGDESLQTDPNGTDIQKVHFKISNKGVIAYQTRSTSSQAQSLIVGTTAILPNGTLTNYNSTTAEYQGIAIDANGVAAFRATDGAATGIYRSTNLSTPVVPNVSNNAIVLAASTGNVLYTDNDGTTTTLNFTGHPTAPIISYGTLSFGPRNAVMTQGERIAFFSPDKPASSGDPAVSGQAVVGYYHDGVTTIIGTQGTGNGDGATVIHNADDNNDYTVSQISTSGNRNSNPMVNDRGTVVYDAQLSTPTGTTVTALLAWRESTGQTQIVVKTWDGTTDNPTNYGDTYTVDGVPYHISAITVDASTDLAGDVNKDGLSDDNFLAFGITYDVPNAFNGFDQHFAVVSVELPEPTAMSVIVFATSAALWRRKRRAKLCPA